MTESEFNKLYKRILDHIADTIEVEDAAGDIEIDLNADILALYNENGTYIINKQSSIQEIWLSSPVSGPHHFSFQSGEWISSKGDAFFQLLSSEIGINISI